MKAAVLLGMLLPEPDHSSVSLHNDLQKDFSRKTVSFSSMSPSADAPRKSLTEQAYDYVRNGILRGDMPVGSVIAEAGVAADLGISKTPLRQALQLLRTEGLLEVGPRKQLVVRAFSPEHRNEVLRIREALEEIAIEAAVVVLTDDQIDLLHLSVLRQKRAVDAGNEEEFLELDEQFHITIAQAANLPIVARLLEQIRGFARLMRLGRTQPPEHLREVLAEHQRIVEAIEQRDASRARRELHNHLHHWDYLVAQDDDAQQSA